MEHQFFYSRRTFVRSSALAIGTTLLPFDIFAKTEQSKITVQEIIDIILKNIPGAPYAPTVDTLKSGSPSTIVSGVVTTMFATLDVIHKTIAAKANFIIAHEPTFYNHLDETNWLESSDVFKLKKELLDKNNIAVWRFHDHWHTNNLDGVRVGVIRDLGWEKNIDASNSRVVNLPGLKLSALIDHAKNKLGIKELRFIGDLDQMCKKILLMPGAAGGRSQISELIKVQPDVLICGEVAEWETAEYIRDSRATGKKISLVVLGHSQSEEPGMAYLVEWLQPKVAPIKVVHIESGNPFSFK